MAITSKEQRFNNWGELINDSTLSKKDFWQQDFTSNFNDATVRDGVDQPSKRLAYRSVALRVETHMMMKNAPKPEEQFARSLQGMVSKGELDARCLECFGLQMEMNKPASWDGGVEMRGFCSRSGINNVAHCPDKVTVFRRGDKTFERIDSSTLGVGTTFGQMNTTTTLAPQKPVIRMNGKAYTVTVDNSSPPKLFLTEEGSSVSHELKVDKTEWVKTSPNTFEKKVSPDAPTIDDELAEVVGEVEVW